ncbi:hypothetical protein HN014_08000 [Aquimarina sp. TRL1]|uniref:hypothetical protein n=1 Tax=Aquimarina sp. (strain TRL1) TaxID=2736252 RepID=UPI0015887B8F|nr:hypothetical protein [Aquimarina sp. TRL1]QKX04860.1 hypothetical protein HN014_08000 [Aquimarina sp. TRL1]
MIFCKVFSKEQVLFRLSYPDDTPVLIITSIIDDIEVTANVEGETSSDAFNSATIATAEHFLRKFKKTIS